MWPDAADCDGVWRVVSFVVMSAGVRVDNGHLDRGSCRMRACACSILGGWPARQAMLRATEPIPCTEKS